MSDRVKTQLFINGVATDASDGGTYDIFNPARPDELVGCAAAATPDDVETAMQAAHAAFPAWAALSYAERGDMLRKVAAAITEDMEEVERRAASTARSCSKPGLRFRALGTGLNRPQIMATGSPKTSCSVRLQTTRSLRANHAVLRHWLCHGTGLLPFSAQNFHRH